MTMNAACKIGLEGLRDSLDEDLNMDAVEIAVIDNNGYRLMGRDDVSKQIARLKPLASDEE